MEGRYKSQITGEIKILPTAVFKRLKPIWHRGENLPSQGFVLMPEIQKSDASKKIEKQAASGNSGKPESEAETTK